MSRLVKAIVAVTETRVPIATAGLGSSVGGIVRDTTARGLEEDSLVFNDWLDLNSDRGDNLNRGDDLNGLDNLNLGLGNGLDNSHRLNSGSGDNGSSDGGNGGGKVEFLLNDLGLNLRDNRLEGLDRGRGRASDLLDDLDGLVDLLNDGDSLDVLKSLVFDGGLVDGLNDRDSLYNGLDDRGGFNFLARVDIVVDVL